ncbi:hypothetical protein AB0I80_12330 [Nonomuraea rubra]
MGVLTPFTSRFRHPAQVVVAAFGLTAAVGTTLLVLPISTAEGVSAGWVAALFTATSAVCVTGLAIMDTESHWSVFGELAGLSTGITANVGTAGHLLLVVLMFIGRIGPLTLGSALALNRRARHYELPEERVIVG